MPVIVNQQPNAVKRNTEDAKALGKSVEHIGSNKEDKVSQY